VAIAGDELIEGSFDNGEFIGPWTAGQDGAVGEGDAVFWSFATVGEDAFTEGAGGFEVLRVVHQLQGLQRRVAPFAASARLFAVGGVKVAHEGRRSGPLEERVDTAAIDRAAMVL